MFFSKNIWEHLFLRATSDAAVRLAAANTRETAVQLCSADQRLRKHSTMTTPGSFLVPSLSEYHCCYRVSALSSITASLLLSAGSKRH